MGKKPMTAAETVRKSNEKRGMRQVNLRLSDEEMAILERAEHLYGGKKNAVVAGLRLIEGKQQLTNDQLLEILGARLREN